MTSATAVSAIDVKYIACRERTCPICQETTMAPYGAISDKLACCSKPCCVIWEALTFIQRQNWPGYSKEQKADILAGVQTTAAKNAGRKIARMPIPDAGYPSAASA